MTCPFYKSARDQTVQTPDPLDDPTPTGKDLLPQRTHDTTLHPLSTTLSRRLVVPALSVPATTTVGWSQDQGLSLPICRTPLTYIRTCPGRVDVAAAQKLELARNLEPPALEDTLPR